MIASTVMYLRVLVAVAVVSQEFLADGPAADLVLMLLTLLPAIVLWFRVRRAKPSARCPSSKTRRN